MDNQVVDLVAGTLEMRTKEALLKNFLSAYYKGGHVASPKAMHVSVQGGNLLIHTIVGVYPLVILELIRDFCPRWKDYFVSLKKWAFICQIC